MNLLDNVASRKGHIIEKQIEDIYSGFYISL
jgi:hypothetical protein